MKVHREIIAALSTSNKIIALKKLIENKSQQGTTIVIMTKARNYQLGSFLDVSLIVFQRNKALDYPFKMPFFLQLHHA